MRTFILDININTIVFAVGGYVNISSCLLIAYLVVKHGKIHILYMKNVLANKYLQIIDWLINVKNIDDVCIIIAKFIKCCNLWYKYYMI